MNSLSLEEIAKLTGSKIIGDSAKQISNVADLDQAEASDISFLSNPRYENAMKNSKAGAIFASPSYAEIEGKTWLIHEEPSRAFQIMIDYFNPQAAIFTEFTGIHETAVIHPSAQLDHSVSIGPHAVIDGHVKIGKNTFIASGVYVGPYSEIGDDCHIMPNVTIRERSIIGSRVILQPGCVIGSCGFGYTQDKMGRHVKLNQVGLVRIEDDVELGANTTVDRSRFKETLIGQGTKIDNMVQIGHGVTIGRYNIIVSQAGIAGSSKTGVGVVIGGQVGVVGHIEIADGVMIAAKAGISKSIEKKGGKYNGSPAMPIEEYNKNMVYLRRVSGLFKRVDALEKNHLKPTHSENQHASCASRSDCC